jgi:CBS domain containing-hemolysin-like protein
VLVLAIVLLVLLASMLALAAAAISRVTHAHAVLLRQQGHSNAAVLERIEKDPARYLNAVHLSALFAQNSSAILVAIAAQRYLGDLGITVASVLFALAYFVVVEAMSKTLAVLHSDRVALLLAPFVWFLGWTLALPARALIGLANVLLPGEGLKQGPFVSEAEIRSLAELGHREGVIEEREKEIIHSVFQLGERSVREVMVPRPDIVATEFTSSLPALSELIVQRGLTRIPVYRGDLDRIEGIVHAKDVLNMLHQGRGDAAIVELLRPVRFVPESKRLVELLHEMQAEQFHLAVVSDEYGSVSGLVTLEDLLEELVGQINDEHDREAPEFTVLGEGSFRVIAALPITELNELLGASLPHDRWNTVGGLMFGLLGAIPAEGAAVEFDGYRFVAEKIHGRRIATVLVTRTPAVVG